MIFQDWRLWVALGMIAFWIWRVLVMPTPIGLVLFATSALLPAAGLFLVAAVRRASGRSET
jgi:hypothetical protein